MSINHLIIFFQQPDFPATRVHLTAIYLFIAEEPSTRCSFTLIKEVCSKLYTSYLRGDLDPRLPIIFSDIFSLLTLPK